MSSFSQAASRAFTLLFSRPRSKLRSPAAVAALPVPEGEAVAGVILVQLRWCSWTASAAAVQSCSPFFAPGATERVRTMMRCGRLALAEADLGVSTTSMCLPGGTMPSDGTDVSRSGEVKAILKATACPPRL